MALAARAEASFPTELLESVPVFAVDVAAIAEGGGAETDEGDTSSGAARDEAGEALVPCASLVPTTTAATTAKPTTAPVNPARPDGDIATFGARRLLRSEGATTGRTETRDELGGDGCAGPAGGGVDSAATTTVGIGGCSGARGTTGGGGTLPIFRSTRRRAFAGPRLES